MDTEEEDHNYHHGSCVQKDIFRITGTASALLSQNSVGSCCKQAVPQRKSLRNGDNGFSDLLQMERVDKTTTAEFSLGTVFPGEHVPYASLSHAFNSAKSPNGSCESCSLEPGSTTTLLESPQSEKFAEDCCEPVFVHWNWPAIRIGCLILCISSLVAVLCVVVGILLLRPPSCDPSRSWWQGAVMYEVFTASFVDSDQDGFGDMRGLVSKLDYVKRLKVSAIRLTSVFSALDYPLEYEHIIDFDNVDPHLGRMEDFEHLVREVHRNGLRLVLDINPTVTSDQHTWAAHWLLNQHGDYAYYYISANDSSGTSNVDEDWEDDRRDPNRLFGNQLYLNWSHPGVRQSVLQAMNVWLEKGVDGIYLKHIERIQVRNDHELYEILSSWRRLLDRYDESDGRGRILMTSIDLVESLSDRNSLLLQPIVDLFDLLDIHVAVEGGPANVSDIFSSRTQEVQRWRNASSGPWFSWNLGDSESPRLGSRIDVDPLTALFALWSLPGSLSLLYGDEIGQKDAIDVTSGRPYRSGQLGVMQWSPAPHANFTSSGCSPWLAAHPDHSSRNVDNASEVLDALSRLTDLRESVVTLFMDGVVNLRRKASNFRVLRRDTEMLVLERFYPRRARYGAVVNFASYGITRDLSDFWFEGNVVAGTGANLPTRINFRELYLEPSEALLIEITS